MPRPRKAPVATGEQSPMTELENAVVEAAQVEVVEAPKPQRKFAKQLQEAPVTERIVTCKVTQRGADKISTGLHVDNLGDEKFAAGETYQTELSNALMMRDGDLAYWIKNQEYRDYVEIIDADIPRSDFRSQAERPRHG